MDTTELFSRQVAAEWLARHLQEKSVDQWALFLRNNANNARRTVYRVPVEQIGRGSFYKPGELEKFVQFEQGRQLGTLKLSGRAAQAMQAYGIGQAGGSAKGRNWKGGGANLGNDKGTVFVQAVINEPLTVFAMTAEQAIEFGRELVEAGKAAQRQSGQSLQQLNLGGYETLVDTPAVAIKRKGQP
jgi:hypothetical protein